MLTNMAAERQWRWQMAGKFSNWLPAILLCEDKQRMARNKQTIGTSKESVKIVLLGEGMLLTSGMLELSPALWWMICLHSCRGKPQMSPLFPITILARFLLNWDGPNTYCNPCIIFFEPWPGTSHTIVWEINDVIWGSMHAFTSSQAAWGRLLCWLAS